MCVWLYRGGGIWTETGRRAHKSSLEDLVDSSSRRGMGNQVPSTKFTGWKIKALLKMKLQGEEICDMLLSLKKQLYGRLVGSVR